MSQQFELAVVGGGVIGLAASLAMVQRGFRVALIDASSLTVNFHKKDARVYAINQASQDLLQEIKAWQYLDSARISPYQQMYVWDASSAGDIEFDARTIAEDRLGSIIEESVLKQALLQALSAHKNISLFANQRIKTLDLKEESIEIFAEDCSWQAELLMIADGATSFCRQLLKVPMNSWPYHQEAIVALVTTEKPHQQTAYQVFNPDGPLAFLPLNDKNLCSIVWSTTQRRAQELMSDSDEHFNQKLREAFADKLGEVAVQGKRVCFPLVMRHVKQYTGPRWLLLGDAAHTIHPLAGLGLNVGLADLATWLSCFDQSNQTLNSPRVLSAYQRQRKHAVWQLIAMMEGLKTLFANPIPPVISLRGLGLKLCNRFSPIKRLFIEQAIGKKGLP